MKKIFETEFKSDLEKFYLNETLYKKYPALFDLCRSLLVFIPSSAFNEQVNSTLGAVRNKQRNNLKFVTTRALLLVDYNSDLINLKNVEDVKYIRKYINDNKA
jgi:hypothetical protein